ncbi:MAG TPA: HAMP domain-containing sensor histidine kinase [Rhodopila sp.]|nr:HAMP domain-containing sensor histidine kinase [Rhodopila sp.]
MNPARLFRGGAYRLSVMLSVACVFAGVLLFVAIYLQTDAYETKRLGAFVSMEAATVSEGSAEEILWTVQRHRDHNFWGELNDPMVAALVGKDGHPIAGNVRAIPPDLPADGQVHKVELVTTERNSPPQPMIAVARRLPDGTTLVFGRGIHVLTTLASIVAQAMIMCAIPAIGLVLAAGIWLSRQAQWRVKAVNQSIQRIMEGNIHERLPVQDLADDFDHLADSVNRMLEEIETLLEEVQAVGDNIAHDLRTPLARVRAMLERGRDRAKTREELVAVTDRAIIGLDQAQSIITALLRIGEIEGGQRRAGFGEVELHELGQETGELYGPIAEAKEICFQVETESPVRVHGDRDLLIEAIANLVDNAIKFTPSGGTVRLLVGAHEQGPFIRITDTGPGIPPEERAAVMRRFYRLDKSRHITGSGLGLSIVLAIVKLHEFDIVVGDANPGGSFELRCFPPRPEADPVRPPVSRRLVPSAKAAVRCGGGGETNGGPSDGRATPGAVSEAA